MVAPALPAIARELKVTNSVEQSLILSIFVLAYAVGPLFLGPLSEINGRVIVLQLANLFYLAFNIGCGFAQTKGQLIAFRFLAGLGGSAPLAVREIFFPPFLTCAIHRHIHASVLHTFRRQYSSQKF